MVVVLLVPLALGGTRDDVKAGPATSAAEIAPLAELLAKAGWQATPELSGVFAPGRVFEVAGDGHRLLAKDCFTAPPLVSTYTSAEVTTKLQAGVGVSVGPVKVKGAVGLTKKVVFGSPEQHTIERLGLQPTPDCASRLAGLGPEVAARSYVVQEALLATIEQQTCGSIDASGKFVVAAEIDAEFAQACAVASLEPVVVGYRTVPLADVLAAGASGPVAVPDLGPVRGGVSISVPTIVISPVDRIHLAAEQALSVAVTKDHDAKATAEQRRDAWCALTRVGDDNPYAGQGADACDRWTTYTATLRDQEVQLAARYDELVGYVALPHLDAPTRFAKVDAVLTGFAGLASDPLVTAETRARMAELGRAKDALTRGRQVALRSFTPEGPRPAPLGDTAQSGGLDLPALVEEGTAALDAGDYDRALSLLREAEQLDPKDLEVRLRIAQALLWNGNQDSGVSLLCPLLTSRSADVAERASTLLYSVGRSFSDCGFDDPPGARGGSVAVLPMGGRDEDRFLLMGGDVSFAHGLADDAYPRSEDFEAHARFWFAPVEIALGIGGSWREYTSFTIDPDFCGEYTTDVKQADCAGNHPGGTEGTFRVAMLDLGLIPLVVGRPNRVAVSGGAVGILETENESWRQRMGSPYSPVGGGVYGYAAVTVWPTGKALFLRAGYRRAVVAPGIPTHALTVSLGALGNDF